MPRSRAESLPFPSEAGLREGFSQEAGAEVGSGMQTARSLVLGPHRVWLQKGQDKLQKSFCINLGSK